MSLLEPVQHALAAVVAGVHTGLTSLGADASSGATWCLSIAAVVVVVRTLLLPLTVHTVKMAHASSRARPHLKELAERYKGRTDAESIRAMMEERRAVSAEHGVSRLGCLPVLLQIPIWIALYHLLRNVADGQAVGALDAGQVESLARATIAGVHLTSHGYTGAGAAHLAVVLGLAGTAAVLSFATQRFLVQPNSAATDLPEAMASAQRIVPFMSAGGMLLAGTVVPVALLFYWACGAVWTFSQSAVVWRFFPTPGSPAAARWAPDA
ncbi:membrane protein insertase YidC [Nocardioides rubriscoriae]|uniref:membrane protein insertase YidC n=1 Tax=Nocardioides rubriscoriae TaxID=642762 RepID=UPI0011E02ED3|nr:membrane protein insertase YidC [Nocardioides rubriscoriae]